MGTNVFAQDLTTVGNSYVFPPFCLIYPLLRFLQESGMSVCTFIAPSMEPVPVWYPTLHKLSIQKICLARRGDRGAIMVPSKNGFVKESQGIKWDLFAYRLKLQ